MAFKLTSKVPPTLTPYLMVVWRCLAWPAIGRVADFSWLRCSSSSWLWYRPGAMSQNHKNWFPTCQVRVVRFYQSCSSPPPSSSSASPSSSTTSASTSTSTVALPTLGQALRQLRSSVRTARLQPKTFPAQCAPLDLNLGPSQLSAHRWTSTWDLPTSIRTAGAQPGTFRAQCAPLDLNLGPSELSAHRWTSTATR